MSNWKAWEQEFLANADNPAFGLPKAVPTPTMVDKRPQQAAPEEGAGTWDGAKAWVTKAGEDIAQTVGRSYLWSKEDYNRRAKELATRMGVDADVVSAAGQESLEAWERTFDVMETGKRADEFARVWSDWDDISATDRAIRVHNYAPIHETMGVVENALRGVRQMDAQLKMAALGDEKMAREEQGLDTTEIDERIRELAAYAQAQTGDDAFIHDTAGQVYMTADMTARSGKEMLVGAGTGALAGAAAGATAGGIGAIPGAYAGFWPGAFLGWNMGQANRMNEMSRGLAYIEARQGNEYGRMSVQDAATYAKAVGISEAALEFGTGIIGAKALAMGRRVVGKVTGKTAADDIIRRAARAIATETNIKDAAKTFLKAGAMSAGAEITEEVLQEAAGNAVWNAIATGTNGARKIPLADMVENSLQAGWDAAPAVLGMSMLMGAGANVRFVNKAAHMMLPEFQMQKEAITNAVGQRMVADLLADKDTNALFKKDPALYAETVQQAANDAGVGSFWADAQTLMASEEGRGALNSLVREGVITQEALETAVQTEGRIEVPVGTYLQADLTEDERAAAQTATTWTEGGMLPAELDERRKALAVSKYAAALEEEMQRTADAIEHVVNDQFSTYSDADKDVVREVMAVNPRNLREGYTSVRQSLIEAIEGITGDVESMRQNHGEGVDYIPFDGDGEEVTIDSKDIHYSRRSSVNELWYSKFYETYGRAPRWIEYYDIALDEMKGDIEQLYGTPEYDEGIAEYNRGKELYERLEALEGLRDDLYAVQDTGMLTLKASLTDDGLAVYLKVQDVLTSVGGEAAEAAEQAAFLWAKRAETFARIMQDMGRNGFTARDYLEMHPIFAEDTFGAGKKAPEQYWQLNDDVDPNETVRITNITSAVQGQKRLTKKELLERLNGILEGLTDLEFVMTDNRRVDLGKREIRHIAFSPARLSKRQRKIKSALQQTLYDIVLNSRRIETGDNRKKDKKPKIQKYHRYYAAVRVGASVYPIRLVVEEKKESVKVRSTNLYLYDVIPEKKKASRLSGLETTLKPAEAPSEITIHDLLNGVKDMDDNPYFPAQDYPDMPLVALHNTDARKVRHMHELGGIALPSIAVTRADLPYTNFGDITLIGDAAFIDPEQKENAAYDADVYSPRYPEIYGYKVEKDAAERFAQMLGTNLAKFSGETLSRTDRALLQTALENGVDGTVKGTGLTRERTVRDAWLGAQGKTQADFASEGDRDWYIREHMEAFREWVETQFAGVNKQAIMFAGYTRGGNRRTKDYTLDNIVEHMRGEIRNGEGELYSVGNLRAAHAKQYKNVAGMQQDRGRIVRQEDMQAWKDKLNAKWEELTKGLSVEQLHAVEDIILNRAKRKWQALLNEAGISEIGAKELRAFVKEITDAPTEYFEVKKQGAVGLDEFIGAVIPDDTPADVREILTAAGLEIFEYDRANGASDAVFAATEELHQERGNILFQAENDIGRWDIAGAAGYKAKSNWTKAEIIRGFGVLYDDLANPNGRAARAGLSITPAITLEEIKSLPRRVLAEHFLRFHQQRRSKKGKVLRDDYSVDPSALLKPLSYYQDLMKTGKASPTQARNRRIVRGMTSIENGKRAMTLFRDGANYSTFIHESGHIFLEDLRLLAESEDAPAWLVRDWETVKAWMGWKDGATDNTKAHEKFARGFEAYVREGKAPTKDLRGVFRTFRKWLTAVYETLIHLGEVPPKDVQRVMERMLATQDAIDAYTAERALDEMAKADEKLAAARGNLVDGLYEEVLEELRAIETRESNELLETLMTVWLDQRKAELAELPVYRHEALYTAYGFDAIRAQYANEDDYRRALEDAGGALTERLEREAEEQRETFREELLAPDALQERVKKRLASGEGQALYSAKELAAIEKKKRELSVRYMALLRELDGELPGGPTNRDRIRQVLRFLRDELPDDAGAKDAVQELAKRVSKLKDADTTALDEEKARLKGLLQERLDGLRLVRDSTKGQIRQIEARAKDAIAQGTVGAAYTWKAYQNKVAYYSRLAAEATARGAYAEAAEMKQRELYHAYLAKQAVAAREQIEKDKRKLADNLKRITRKDAPIIMDVQSRYFIEHLMYRLGLTQTDAVMPADGFELAAVARLLDVDAEFGMAGSEVIPESVRQLLAGGRRDENAWRHISVSEWEEVAETLTVVYKVGRRAQEGVTIKDAQGKNVAIADAATELAKDLAGRFGRDDRDLRRIEQERTLVDKVVHTGAGLLAELIKPEVILNRLDGRAGSRGAGLFHRYIYMPIEQAMNKKRELEAQGKKELHAIFERRYSASELREMRTKRKYAVGERERYTKEEILCAALNWGTKQNRQRTCFTFGVGERDMLQVFEDVLDSRDWDTVEAVWALLDSYFDERSRINERERGVSIAKVEPLAFSVGGKRRALLPESPTREELLAKPDVQVVDVVVPQEVKKFKKSFKDFRTAVKNWLINRAKGSYLNRELGDIQLATNGIKHAVSSAYDTDKQAILLMLPQIIEHGVVTSVEKNKSNDANIRKVFFLYTPVRYAGKSYLVKSVVKEMSDGKRYYDARTTEIKTADGWSAQPLLSKQPRERIPKSVSGSSTVSVAELLKYVNEIEGVRVLKGGYYPIVYDPQLSVRASDLEVAQELTRQMSSNAVFGSGLSATKKRQAVVHRELFLSLDVIPRAMNEAILHISMREAVLDVAHLLDHENLAEPLQKVIGVSQYRVLRQWVRDCWREDTDIAKGLEMYAETLRRNSVFAVMAYRASTAALNICNFPMAMWEIGPVRFLRALLKFYLHPQRTARAIKAKSSFLAEREENLDRDLARGMRIAGKETTVAGVTLPVGAAVDVKAQIDRFGYYAITKTDLMLSYPAWQARYEDTVRELIEAGETDVERIEREAIARADEAVRRVWGSGETKDMARVQKGRIMKYFTPFYTFFSTVLNAHIEAGYALKDRGDVRPLISTVFAWIIVQAAMETLLRMAIDEATGRGDDDDFYAAFLKEYARNATGTLVGGLPIIRDAVNGLTMQLTGEYFPSRGSQVVALRIVEDMADFTAAVASDKKDWIDVGRSGARVMNRLTGFSDTLSDGIFTFIRFALTDTEATWDEAVAAMVFDRKLKKGK